MRINSYERALAFLLGATSLAELIVKDSVHKNLLIGAAGGLGAALVLSILTQLKNK